MSGIKKVIIIGGVAGGASVAARLRRLSENVEIIMIQRGRYVSFANCGLPYHIGGEIEERESLLIQTPKGLNDRFNIDVRVENEVTDIDRSNNELTILDLSSGDTYKEKYDALVLSPGAEPLTPALPGINRPGHYSLRTIRDMDDIIEWNEKIQPKHAVVVGGGFIGLEMAEQLHHIGMEVSLIEASSQVLSPIDEDMAKWLEQEMQEKGVQVLLNSRVKAFEPPSQEENSKASTLIFEDGTRLPADLVILSIGVKPEVDLAKNCGLTVGEFGGIRVNDHMRTDDHNIWAVGDAVEVRHPATHNWTLIPLAGPANRQARIAADCIMGRASKYRGTWGTSIVRVFDLTAACTGLNEKQLEQMGISYEVANVHPFSHVSYYPNAEMLLIKLLFSAEDGTIYGAQVVGKDGDGVARRMDVLATAIQGRLTVNDLAHLELCYAPAFGAPKDAVNTAGMVARNIVNDDISSITTSELQQLENYHLIDVSSPQEFDKQKIPNSINIPIDELRGRLNEVPKDKKIIVSCYSGQRSYFAYRMMMLHGFDVSSLSGGFRSWQYSHQVNTSKTETAQNTNSSEDIFNQTVSYLNDVHHLQSKKSSTLKKREALVGEKEKCLRKKLALLKGKYKYMEEGLEEASITSDTKTSATDLQDSLHTISHSLDIATQKESDICHEYEELDGLLNKSFHQLLEYKKQLNRLPDQNNLKQDIHDLNLQIETAEQSSNDLKKIALHLVDRDKHINYLIKRVNKQEISLNKKEELLNSHQKEKEPYESGSTKSLS